MWDLGKGERFHSKFCSQTEELEFGNKGNWVDFFFPHSTFHFVVKKKKQQKNRTCYGKCGEALQAERCKLSFIFRAVSGSDPAGRRKKERKKTAGIGAEY